MKTAALWLLAMTLAACLAPAVLSDASEAMDFSRVLEPPSLRHPFGTDALGRDLSARMLCGARASLGVAFAAVGLAVGLGTLVGAVGGYYGGRLDRLLMGLVDVMLCFPVFFLILAVIAILGPNILNIMLVIGVTGWMGTARLVRAEVLSLKERDFIQACRAMGAGGGRILLNHLIPNAAGPVIVNAVLGVSSAILAESGLSFLGIGVQPPTPSWGNILTDSKAALGVAWWLTFFPGLFIFLTVLSANVLGERFREELHPGN